MEWGSIRKGANDSYWTAQEKEKQTPINYFRKCLDSSLQWKKG
jgi:hypothetical protein